MTLFGAVGMDATALGAHPPDTVLRLVMHEWLRLRPYSGSISPEPPNSDGKSFSFGRPSFIGNTVSA